MNILEKGVKVDMTLPQRQSFHPAPILITSGIVIHMIMADMVLLAEPGLFLPVQKGFLLMESRHLGIPHKMDSGIGLRQLFQVFQRIFLITHHILHQQIQPIVIGHIPQSGVNPQIVFKTLIRNLSVPQM